MNRLIIIVPQELLVEAMNLLKETNGDQALTFGSAQWTDDAGAIYSVAAGLFQPDFLDCLKEWRHRKSQGVPC